MSELVIYRSEAGTVEVRLDGDTVWLRQEQLSQLFGRDRTVIGRHLRNVFAEGELARESNVQNLHIAGSDKPVGFYNLDVIISVGYRVKSPAGVRFRQWATRVLREHLTRGYTLDRQRFDANAQELEAALALIRQTARSPQLIEDAGRGLIDIATRYAQTFLLLQRYDEGLLTEPPTHPGGRLPTPGDARSALGDLKARLIARGEAFLFIDFLHRNGQLFGPDGQPLIDDIALTALTLLIAESDPARKDTMIRLVMNLLTPAGGATA